MTGQFVRTDTIMDRILTQKLVEIADLQAALPLAEARRLAEAAAYAPRDFTVALRRETVALIAEVKHASPSKGVLIEPFDPVAIGRSYAENGAAAISVLTDEQFFRGHLDYLRQVREAVGCPVLRKDFIVDAYQVYHMLAADVPADACLLIVAALDDAQLAELYALITGLGMAALVEVHNEAEMERALRLGARLIGVNNRDLKTFTVDLETTARLAAMTPDGVTLVAESGIMNAEDVHRMGRLGAHAVLVGESLVKADDMAAAVREYSSVHRSAE